ncbi:MAG: hypothetical protein HOP03_00100 [Lysobacter sp.]|nr:hypothetical protein [Lysobacter sp.]
MTKIFKAHLAVLIIALASCASVQVSPPRAGSWTDLCYTDFDRDVSETVGEPVVDCGFLSAISSKTDRSATKACARDAVNNGKPFKFGYSSFGYDSAFCDVALRRADGQLISFFFDSDVTGQFGTNGNNSTVWTSRCSAIEFKPGTIGHGSFFDMQGCVEAPEIFSGLSSRK